ncbi:MAG: hopanoid C-3 methylase HpnR [Phycisphaeraceae bacterium]|nr:hopanoid C-3 methylase HpnR [Phycisphaeraceae bacterium]
MRVLFVQPSALMFSEVYLRLEPLGLERVAGAARRAGHEVRLLDLAVYSPKDFFTLVDKWQPQAVAFSLNYFANVPEVIDLAKFTRQRLADCLIFVGGHSVSFVPEEVLEHAQGAIDAVVRGEGEEITPQVLATGRHGGLEQLPGVVTRLGSGPAPLLVQNLDEHLPARDLGGRRHKYFIGHLDPCASVEFTRGCPWDCSFCSAWTFYGRSYRKLSVEASVEDLAAVREPNVFLVDDVAFIKPDHGMAIADAVEKRGIRKEYYLETRADVLLRNPEVFERWARLGLSYMFLGIEALDEEQLKIFRKRTTPNKNFEALDVARRLGIRVAINIIADPAWDEKRFDHLREWALKVPEIVHVTVQTPYPGTEIWHTESRKLTTLDYRLFDVQHAVLPTTLPLKRFYEELVKTQAILNRKHLGWSVMRQAGWIALKLAMKGQTNFLRSLWKFSSVFNAERQYQDHQQPVKYAMRPPRPHPPASHPHDGPGHACGGTVRHDELYVHVPLTNTAAPVTP